jgi:hypothetical protein
MEHPWTVFGLQHNTRLAVPFRYLSAADREWDGHHRSLMILTASPAGRHDRVKRQIPLDAKPLTVSRRPSPKIASNSASRQTR